MTSAILSISLYQPHFITTYLFNYGRGIHYIKSNSMILIYFPVLLLVLLTSLVIQNSTSILSDIYLLVLGAGSWHFMKQTIAATKWIQGSARQIPSDTQKWLQLSMMTAAAFGVLKFIEIKGGSLNFFGLRTETIAIPGSLLSTIYWLFVFMSCICLIKCFRNKLNVKALIPWVAFSLWYTSDLMLRHYFYIIPIFHSLQYLPFFFERSRSYLKWRSVCFLMIISLIVIQVVPSTVDTFLTNTKELNQVQIFFVSTLLFVNLHHFMMETITWKVYQP
jgi:hypothetical protein